MEFPGYDDATAAGRVHEVSAQGQSGCGQHGLLVVLLCRGPANGNSLVHGGLPIRAAARCPTRVHSIVDCMYTGQRPDGWIDKLHIA